VQVQLPPPDFLVESLLITVLPAFQQHNMPPAHLDGTGQFPCIIPLDNFLSTTSPKSKSDFIFLNTARPTLCPSRWRMNTSRNVNCISPLIA
jgi:hypothetical protein